MASSKYLVIYPYSGDEFYASCTDKVMLDWVVNEVKKYCPTVKVRTFIELPNGEPYQYEFKNVYADHPSKLVPYVQVMEPWLIKQLLDMGWEPLGSLQTGSRELIIHTD